MRCKLDVEDIGLEANHDKHQLKKKYTNICRISSKQRNKVLEDQTSHIIIII